MLVSRSELSEENALEVFHQLWGSLVFFLNVKFQVRSWKIVMWLYSRFLSTVSCRWQTCGSSAFNQFPILNTKSCPDLCTLIHPPRRSLALGREWILIPGFIRSSHMLAIYSVAHSLPLGGVDRDYPFTEDETWRLFSYLSGNFTLCLVIMLF